MPRKRSVLSFRPMEPCAIGPRVTDGMRVRIQGAPLAMLDRIVKTATTVADARLACMWVVDSREQALRPQAGYATDARLAALIATFTPVPVTGGAVGHIFESRLPDYIADIRQDPRWRKEPCLVDAGLRAHAGVPLLAGDHAVGVLSVLFGRPRQLRSEEKDLLAL